MIPRSVKAPTIPIPFHKLLKVVAVVDRNNAQTAALLDLIRAEGYEVEVCDHFDRDLAEDASVGAYIALVDGERREPARAAAQAVRALGFRTPLWALADSSRIADMAVLGMVGEVDGFIYLGQQTPEFYAKQVIAGLVDYGLSLLPPFFGGLMAYDAAANIAFDCPGHQGGQFYRKSPTGQMFFKYFGESIFRNDLCNADVDLGDLLIHEGAAAQAQKEAAKVFGADRTYFVLNGTSTSNKVVTNAVLKRGDLVLFDRNNHKSLHQGALVGAGAIPVFLPTARNAFGMIGPVDWEAWDEASLRAQIRANPLVTDKSRADAPRPFRLACIQLCTYDGTIYNVQKVLEKIGHLCDYVLWDEAWIGYNAFHPLFDRAQPDAAEGPGPRDGRAVLDAERAQAGRRFLAGQPDPQARRAHPRPEALHQSQALQRVVPDARLDLAVLPAVCVARRQRAAARRQGRRDAVGPLHRTRHRGAQEAARVRAPLREDRARRAGAVVLRPLRARPRDDQPLALCRRRHRRALGKPAHRADQAASSSAGTSSPTRLGTATVAWPRAMRWSTRTS